jgi:hypothetical protein
MSLRERLALALTRAALSAATRALRLRSRRPGIIPPREWPRPGGMPPPTKGLWEAVALAPDVHVVVSTSRWRVVALATYREDAEAIAAVGRLEAAPISTSSAPQSTRTAYLAGASDAALEIEAALQHAADAIARRSHVDKA